MKDADLLFPSKSMDCVRSLVTDGPDLQNAGYVVKYREFDGPHAVPPVIAQEALAFL